MIEGFERNGQWWLVGEPRNKFQGKLNYNHKDGAILTISLTENDLVNFNKVKPYIILGRINNENITLINCRFIGVISAYGELRTCMFITETIFSGAHFHHIEDIKFTSIEICYSFLDEWIDINSFSHSYSENGEEIIKYKKPINIQVSIDADTSIIFTPFVRSNVFSRFQKEAYIKQKWITRIEKKDEATLDEFLDIIKHLQTFLSLAIKEPVHVLKLDGKSKIYKEPDIDYFSNIGIYYRSFYISKPPEYFYSDVLFSFQDIKTQFNKMIINWFKKRELLEPICGLYFGVLVNPYLYPETQFLNLVQAVEAFHKRINITKKCSLEKRVDDLISKYGDIVPQLLMGRSQDPNRINIARQHFTHYDKGSDKYAAKGKELLRLTYKLKVLLEVCLIMQTGLEDNKAKELFAKHRGVREEAIGRLT